MESSRLLERLQYGQTFVDLFVINLCVEWTGAPWHSSGAGVSGISSFILASDNGTRLWAVLPSSQETLYGSHSHYATETEGEEG